MGEYTRGIAFVLEGATEKVFYRAFLKWFAEQNNCSFVKGDNLDNGDIYFEWDNGAETILIKFNIVGTVTQVSHSGKPINAPRNIRCRGKYFCAMTQIVQNMILPSSIRMTGNYYVRIW